MHYTNDVKIFRSCLAILFLLLLVACSPTGKAGNNPQATLAPIIQAPVPSQPVPWAPTARIHFGRLGLEDGLSQSTVMAILQDNQGFLWFGTQDGLNRYDGVKFKIFRPVAGDTTSLSDVWICSLALDAEGVMWVGTRQGGANRYNASTGTFDRFQHQPDVPDSLSDNNVHTIFIDAQGQLWFGTGAGLDIFDPKNGSFDHFSPPDVKSLFIEAIAQDSQKNLWLGTDQGLWRFDPIKQIFTPQKIGEKANPIHDIQVNPDNTLWLATRDGGLVHFNPLTGASKSFLPEDGLSHEDVNNLLRDSSGKIWAATSNGLNLLDPETGKLINYFNDPNLATSLSANSIHSLYQDRSSILWIGTFGGSLSYYDPLENKFSHFYPEPGNPKSLASGFIFSIAPALDHTVWLGTYGVGVDHYDPLTSAFTHYRNDPKDPDSLRDDLVWYILPDREGKVWMGTQTGLDQFDPATGKFSHYSSDENDANSLPGETVYVIHQDRAGTIWVGTNKGLARFDAATKTFTRYNQTDDAGEVQDWVIIDITEDANGIMWIGSSLNGLSRLDPETSIITTYRHHPQKAESLSNDYILVIYQAKNGSLWVGTAGGGLNLFDPSKEAFITYNENNGLPNNVIYGILEDALGMLWLSTNLGIARFDPKTGTSRNYTVADGLQSNEFNMGAYAVDADGWMYFGGINGYNVFHPSVLRENQYTPPISLVSLTQNGMPTQPGLMPESIQQVTFKHPDNSFEFEAAALSYSQSYNNQYAYKLEGFDTGWYYAGTNRSGRYANLPGGEYTLRLKAANADGVWNEEGIALKLTVIPPFWQAWWFYSLVGLFALGIVAGVYLLRIRTVEMQKRELERQVSERTRQIEQLFEKNKELVILEERNRLARDLHDSAKQKAFAALAQIGATRSLANGDVGKANKHLQEAETLVGEVIEEITFLIQELHPVALKEKGLATALRQYVFEWGSRFGIEVKMKIEGERRLPLEIEQMLYRSIQEALANVARHSGASVVDLMLHIQPACVAVLILDNGLGFDTQSNSEGLGLHTIRERVESLGGSFDIESTIGKGTQLAIQIPVKDLP